jgi:hypothetical protein
MVVISRPTNFFSDLINNKNAPLEYYIQVSFTKSAVGGSHLQMMITGARLIVLSKRLLASVLTTLCTRSYGCGFCSRCEEIVQ